MLSSNMKLRLVTTLSLLIDLAFSSVLLSCNNKGFLCYDEARFYQCVEINKSTYVTGSLQNCPPGLFCDNASDLECDASERINTPQQTSKKVDSSSSSPTKSTKIQGRTTNPEKFIERSTQLYERSSLRNTYTNEISVNETQEVQNNDYMTTTQSFSNISESEPTFASENAESTLNQETFDWEGTSLSSNFSALTTKRDEHQKSDGSTEFMTAKTIIETKTTELSDGDRRNTIFGFSETELTEGELGTTRKLESSSFDENPSGTFSVAISDESSQMTDFSKDINKSFTTVWDLTDKSSGSVEESDKSEDTESINIYTSKLGNSETTLGPSNYEITQQQTSISSTVLLESSIFTVTTKSDDAAEVSGTMPKKLRSLRSDPTSQNSRTLYFTTQISGVPDTLNTIAQDIQMNSSSEMKEETILETSTREQDIVSSVTKYSTKSSEASNTSTNIGETTECIEGSDECSTVSDIKENTRREETSLDSGGWEGTSPSSNISALTSERDEHQIFDGNTELITTETIIDTKRTESSDDDPKDTIVGFSETELTEGGLGTTRKLESSSFEENSTITFSVVVSEESSQMTDSSKAIESFTTVWDSTDKFSETVEEIDKSEKTEGINFLTSKFVNSETTLGPSIYETTPKQTSTLSTDLLESSLFTITTKKDGAAKVSETMPEKFSSVRSDRTSQNSRTTYFMTPEVTKEFTELTSGNEDVSETSTTTAQNIQPNSSTKMEEEATLVTSTREPDIVTSGTESSTKYSEISTTWKNPIKTTDCIEEQNECFTESAIKDNTQREEIVTILSETPLDSKDTPTIHHDEVFVSSTYRTVRQASSTVTEARETTKQSEKISKRTNDGTSNVIIDATTRMSKFPSTKQDNIVDDVTENTNTFKTKQKNDDEEITLHPKNISTPSEYHYSKITTEPSDRSISSFDASASREDVTQSDPTQVTDSSDSTKSMENISMTTIIPDFETTSDKQRETKHDVYIGSSADEHYSTTFSTETHNEITETTMASNHRYDSPVINRQTSEERTETEGITKKIITIPSSDIYTSRLDPLIKSSATTDIPSTFITVSTSNESQSHILENSTKELVSEYKEDGIMTSPEDAEKLISSNTYSTSEESANTNEYIPKISNSQDERIVSTNIFSSESKKEQVTSYRSTVNLISSTYTSKQRSKELITTEKDTTTAFTIIRESRDTTDNLLVSTENSSPTLITGEVTNATKTTLTEIPPGSTFTVEKETLVSKTTIEDFSDIVRIENSTEVKQNTEVLTTLNISPNGSDYRTTIIQNPITTSIISETSTIKNSTIPDEQLNTTEIMSLATTSVNKHITDHSIASSLAPSLFKCPSIGKFPDPVSCTKFHVCINGIFDSIDVSYECPEGSQYDSYNKECTIDPVQCPSEPSIVCTRSGIFKHPFQCDRYYRCTWQYVTNNYQLKQFRCPDSNEFDARRRRCVRSDRCQSKSVDFECIQQGKFPFEKNCRQYYECSRNNHRLVKKLRSCRRSELFDRNLSRCRNQYLVNCPLDTTSNDIVN